MYGSVKHALFDFTHSLPYLTEMFAVENFFKKIFLLRPVLALLTLQTVCILCYEYHGVAATLLMLVVVTGVGVLHFRTQNISRFTVFVGIVIASLGVQFILRSPLSREILPKTTFYRGQIATLITIRDLRTQVVVDLTDRIAPAPQNISGRIQLSIGETCNLPTGAVVTFPAAIHAPRSYKNPGGFDYRDFLARQNIWGQGFVAYCDDVKVEQLGFQTWWTKFQERIYQRLNKSDLTNGPILAALILGTRTIGTDDAELIRDSGLSHLFAISGMQFAVMAAIVFALISLLTRPFPQLYLKWPRQKIASVATLIFIACYLSIMLPQPSILRAGISIAIYLIATITERQCNLLHVILVSMAAILIIRPMDLFDVSFQLSYLCILALVIILPHIISRLEQKEWFKKSPRPIVWACEIVVVSWTLNILLLPLILMDFGTVSVNGLLHNLWGIPYFDFVVTPLSLAYLLLIPISAHLATPILHIWDKSITLFMKVLMAIGPWQFKTLTLLPPHPIHTLIFYTLVFLFCLTRKKSVLIIFGSALIVTLAATYYDTHFSYAVRITQIDVGQGDAELIQTRHKSMLIDAGGNIGFDMGKNVVAPFLLYEWVPHIDVGVITHADTDHYLGFVGLLDKVSFGEIWLNDRESVSPTYQDLLKKIREKNIPIRIIHDTETLTWDDATRLEILSPTPQMAMLADDNDHSIVIRLAHGDFSALFTGDISQAAENRLVTSQGDALQSSLLKVAHHGSRTSSSAAFLTTVVPHFATIGVAEHSRFGHPHAETLQRLQAIGAEIFRTDTMGVVTVNVKSDGRIKIGTFANAK